MSVVFFELPQCKTCIQAREFLEGHNVCFESRHLADNNPNAEEIKAWHEASGLPIRAFTNCWGVKYRQLGLKAKFEEGLTDEQAYELLASDGLLVRHPLLVVDGVPLRPGFHSRIWSAALGLDED